LKEALCGTGFEIQHLDGRTLNLSSGQKNTVIRPNDKKVIPTLGMRRGDQTGNLIIEFEVVFPETLTTEQVERLNEIL
jgi:DnaJ family protein B protein 4